MTVIPSSLWAWLPQISESELKVWLYLLDQLPPASAGAGIPLRALEQGTGLARSSVMRGQAGLRAKGIVQAEDRAGSATRFHWPASTPLPTTNEVNPPQITPAARISNPSAGERKLRPPANGSAGTDPISLMPAVRGVGVANCVPTGESNRIVLNQTFKKLTDSILTEDAAKSDQVAAAPPTQAYSATALSDSPIPPSAPVSAGVTAQIVALTRQFHPGASPAASRANTTRLLRLYEHSGLVEATFGTCIDTAAARTQARLTRAGVRPLACPISYFFTVLERLLADPPVDVKRDLDAAVAGVPTDLPLPLLVNRNGVPARVEEPTLVISVSPVAGLTGELPAPPAALNAEGSRLWQAALIYLRAAVPADAYGRVVRYAVALDLSRTHGEAVIGVPAEYMRAELAGVLAPALNWALGQVCGRAMRVRVALLTRSAAIAA